MRRSEPVCRVSGASAMQARETSCGGSALSDRMTDSAVGLNHAALRHGPSPTVERGWRSISIDLSGAALGGPEVMVPAGGCASAPTGPRAGAHPRAVADDQPDQNVIRRSAVTMPPRGESSCVSNQDGGLPPRRACFSALPCSQCTPASHHRPMGVGHAPMRSRAPTEAGNAREDSIRSQKLVSRSECPRMPIWILSATIASAIADTSRTMKACDAGPSGCR